ncbi:hypothetical protein GWK41_07530 [Persephonella atlantica]|uniref:Uncharacterized protein n=1 Tax=Persephonella atlantica TaxID=2699429 RepID=A0ABS1GJ16_9AQUI|nr:hypothetical protein [Persephonella atlantica]MBK3332917.1 hypothetical protein [Persephonella atlantica]
MDDGKNKNLFEEIFRYIRKLSGYNLTLSPKEINILEEAIKKGISVDAIKKLIKEEIKKYPPEKRKKFTLLFLEEKIKNIKRTKQKTSKSISSSKLKNVPKELKKIAEENITINHIWKNLTEEEKKEIIKTAIEKMKKGFILTNIDKEKVLRSIIRNIIKERYINGGNK